MFHDRSVRELTSTEWDDVSRSVSRGVTHFTFRDGTIVSFSSIAKIMTRHEYYREYPNNVPVQDNYPPATNIMREPWNVAKSKVAMQQMIAGFKSAFDGREMGENAREILEKMEARLRGEADKVSKKIPQHDGEPGTCEACRMGV